MRSSALLLLGCTVGCASILGIETGVTDDRGSGGEGAISAPGGTGGGGATGGGGTGGGETGGGGTGGAGADTPCGSIDMLSDAFDAGPNANLWVPQETDGSVSVVAGKLRLAAFGNATPSTARLRSKRLYDLKEGTFEVRFAGATLNMASGATLKIGLDDPHQTEGAYFVIEDGMLWAEAVGRASADPIALPANLMGVRLRARTGTLRWETFDGNTWTLFHSDGVTSVFSEDIAAGVIVLEDDATATASSSVDIEEVTNHGTEVGWCDVSTLADGFAGPSTPLWGRRTILNGCVASESDDLLTLTANGAADAVCRYDTGMDYALDEAGIAVPITSVMIPTGGFVAVTLFVQGNDDYVQARVTNNTVELYLFIKGTLAQVDQPVITETGAPFTLRLRRSNNDIELIHSQGAVDEVRSNDASGIVTDAMRVSLGIEAFAPNNGSVTFGPIVPTP